MDLEKFWSDAEYQATTLAAEYLCLGEVFGEDEETHEIALTYWQTEAGHEFLPVFTELAQLEQMEFEEDCPYLVIPLSIIFQLLEPEITVIIDLESEQERVFSAEDIQKVVAAL